MRTSRWNPLTAVAILTILLAPLPARAQSDPSSAEVSPRLRDRGEGVPTSLFGTYVRGGEFLISPFYEHYRDRNFEYTPSELGFRGTGDFRGRYRANEGLVFMAYGITDDLAVEFEMAGIKASLDTSPADVSGLPARIEESGLGDVEGQVRYRWRRETDSRPEVFSYVEYVIPNNGDKLIIGTSGWQWKAGTGFVRGYGWGTLTARAAMEYDTASSSPFDLGEYAVEYLRRLSPSWRIFASLEGTQDELALIGELQWHVGSNVFFRFNSGFGLTSRATDWAPDVGIVYSFGRR